MPTGNLKVRGSNRLYDERVKIIESVKKVFVEISELLL